MSLSREETVAARRATRYRLEYPDALPITSARDELLAAIEAQRAIVVCGDTGSGKTTQLPKLCLEAGRGIEGMIGHTQPRRSAAQAVASRLAAELDVRLGEAVGLTVRFTDRTSPAAQRSRRADRAMTSPPSTAASSWQRRRTPRRT